MKWKKSRNNYYIMIDKLREYFAIYNNPLINRECLYKIRSWFDKTSRIIFILGVKFFTESLIRSKLGNKISSAIPENDSTPLIPSEVCKGFMGSWCRWHLITRKPLEFRGQHGNEGRVHTCLVGIEWVRLRVSGFMKTIVSLSNRNTHRMNEHRREFVIFYVHDFSTRCIINFID